MHIRTETWHGFLASSHDDLIQKFLFVGSWHSYDKIHSLIILRVGKYVRHIAMARSWLGCLFGVLVPSTLFYLYLLLNGNGPRYLYIVSCYPLICNCSSFRWNRFFETRWEIGPVVRGHSKSEFSSGARPRKVTLRKKSYRGKNTLADILHVQCFVSSMLHWKNQNFTLEGFRMFYLLEYIIQRNS